jgi:hypothetical protein
VGKPPLSIAICFYLSAISAMVALAMDAHMLVQIPLAWSVGVFASGMTGQRLPWSAGKQDKQDNA